MKEWTETDCWLNDWIDSINLNSDSTAAQFHLGFLGINLISALIQLMKSVNEMAAVNQFGLLITLFLAGLNQMNFNSVN